ncbi:hypothetical protein NL504_28210, partial [Klebsiella pneumoniae]|nr:hypothetical protein [Klebsiella pneumoniae]
DRHENLAFINANPDPTMATMWAQKSRRPNDSMTKSEPRLTKRNAPPSSGLRFPWGANRMRKVGEGFGEDDE